jgi:acyl-CoA thioester hydrolase
MEIIPVCAAIFIRGGKVLVGRRRGGLNDSGKWEFPGGKILPGEDPRETVKREIEEEFGVRPVVGRLYEAINHEYRDKSVLLLFYFAEIDSLSVSSKDHDEIMWAGPEDLLMLDFLDADGRLILTLSEDLRAGKI